MTMKMRQNRNRIKWTALLYSACCLASASASADELSIQDLMALDIESLSKVEVVSASKRHENIFDAPSIMSVVSADEIERYGAINLHDVLNRVPSLQVLNSTANPNNTVSLRAATNQHYPNRILFMLDGRPVRDSYGGHLNYALFTHYPASNIEQIEVIRGPGSVLYGTNAYAGVVNIISKDGEHKSLELSTTYGSFNRLDQEGRASLKGEDWSISGAFKATDSKGERVEIVDETNTRGEYRTREEGHSYFVKGHYKDFSAMAFYGRAAQSSLGIFARLPESLSDGKKSTFDLGYQNEFLDHTTVEAHVTYNRLRGGFTTDAPELNWDDLLIVELSSITKLFENLNLSLGGSFEHQDGVVANTRYQQHLHSAYAQLDWRPIEDLKLVAGMQLNDSELFKADLSPRLSAIYAPFDDWGLKLLYGEAFRSSTAIERELFINGVIQGDINTQPERIETVEAQIFYGSDDVYAAFSAYRNRIEDIIGRIPNPMGGGVLITNTGEQVFHGLEFEGKWHIDRHWHIEGSASWQTGESDTDIDDPTFAPNLMAKLGVSYKNDFWSIGVFDSWYGDPEDIRGTNPSVLEVNPDPESYHLVSANVNLDVNAMFDLPKSAPKMKLTFYGENLLDEDIDFPEYNRQNINSFPIDNGRAVYGRFTVSF